MNPEPALLALIEGLLTSGRDAEAMERVQHLALSVQLQWEQQSDVFRTGLSRTSWWETLFSRTHPTTYARIKKSLGRRANALSLLLRRENVWRGLLVLLIESDRIDRSVWHVGKDTFSALNVADEFGIDQMHLVRGMHILIHDRRISLASPAFVSLGLHREMVMRPVQAWSVPFQAAVLVLMQHNTTKERELVWIHNEVDVSNWAVNHNNLTENPEDFAAPPFLLGDATLNGPIPLIAATEGRTDIAGAKTAMAAVTIRSRDVMLFDQVQQTQTEAKHWRHLLTQELWEPRPAPVTASCMVLDAFLLFASSDGSLRAHPRGNPRSTYHVEDLQSRVTHLVSLYNVVALVHSHNILEVRLVEQQPNDPFLRFTLLYRATLVDAAHAPLLYGPYLLYASLDGSWNRVLYDSPKPEKSVEPVKVPFKAGWTIITIKGANWRHWTLVLRNPQTGASDEFLLCAVAARDRPAPLLVSSCIECAVVATRLCATCRSVGFCNAHGETHDHPERCRQQPSAEQ